MSTSKRARSSSPNPSSSKQVNPRKPVRFLILSDTHPAHLPSTLPACNVLLHCSDTTEDSTPPPISKALQSLGQIDAELKLVIASTHEISLDKAYYVAEDGSLEDANSARAMTSRSPDSEATRTADGAQRLEFKDGESMGEGEHCIVPCAKGWVGKNQAVRKEYARLPPGSVDKLREGRQTLAVNAAMEGEKGGLENAAWLVELEL